MLIAMTRPVPKSIAQCELTHMERTPIDVGRAAAEHAEYEATLTALGCTVIQLEPSPRMPDSVFIEDTAIVLDELAVITRPGALSRRAETEAVAEALRPYRTVRMIEEPGTIDGGDVLVAGKRIFVGLSSRTNSAAVEALRALVGPFGYSVDAVRVTGSLHLKSAITQLNESTVIANRAWIDVSPFASFTIIDCDPDEPGAANVLRVRDTLLVAAAAPLTAGLLLDRGFEVISVAQGELAKAEAGLTCCSLIFEV